MKQSQTIINMAFKLGECKIKMRKKTTNTFISTKYKRIMLSGKKSNIFRNNRKFVNCNENKIEEKDVISFENRHIIYRILNVDILLLLKRFVSRNCSKLYLLTAIICGACILYFIGQYMYEAGLISSLNSHKFPDNILKRFRSDLGGEAFNEGESRTREIAIKMDYVLSHSRKKYIVKMKQLLNIIKSSLPANEIQKSLIRSVSNEIELLKDYRVHPNNDWRSYRFFMGN